ncbi:RNA polymerase sigma factor [Tunturiibacter gelidoferens]|uniref:RNA polymerase sigma-70 factor (ECF subfamily) n=1 Tax=Tunturiibacter lichenicola TaxID=2051959 RepID=A0A7Y9NNY0_9BACT|nr:RNA polymerase sigma factor [Edaphobacter lichenicola]NYF52848.1 RNA polymerase sigma-70 factor (ECF subfamily) [Edaphobacter lichenicola]
MTPETVHNAHSSIPRASCSPDFAMILKAAEPGSRWDQSWSGSAPWTAVHNPSQLEANRTMLSENTRSADFERLALPLFASLYNHAFWLTHDQAEAEDLVQETFSKALRAFDSFQSGTNFKAWVFRILRNTFLTSRTGIAASRTVYLEDNPETLDTTNAGPTPEDTLIRLDNQAALNIALDQLPSQLREVLLLCDVEEIKYKDIALILDVPIGTVMSRVSRARSSLRQLLQPQFGESL